MLPAKVPQRVMLRQLLGSGQLTAPETERVQQMSDDLNAGRIGGLNAQQAAWAEQLCARVGIVVERAAPPRRKKDETKTHVAAFDALPRPKKPPGK